MASSVQSNDLPENRSLPESSHHCATKSSAVPNGEVSFFSRSAGDLGASLQPERGGTKEQRVIQIKLSSLLRERVDLLKIDIEGGELAVIKELIDSAAIKNVESLIVECHHNVTGLDGLLQSILGMLHAAGFITCLQATFNRKDLFLRSRVFQDIAVYATRA